MHKNYWHFDESLAGAGRDLVRYLYNIYHPCDPVAYRQDNQPRSQKLEKIFENSQQKLFANSSIHAVMKTCKKNRLLSRLLDCQRFLLKCYNFL
jgi:hypothetical protein